MNEQPIPTPKAKYRRSAKNILIKPRQQLRYAAILFAGGAALLALYMIVLLTSLVSTLSAAARQYDLPPEFLHTVTGSLGTSVILIAAVGLVLTVGMLALGVSMSHRIFGPMVPLQRLVGELQKGNYSARGHLRRNDEFQELMADLNALAEKLQAVTASVRE